jgi:diguanylate cyclase (GGDEF)-like protein
LEDLTVSPERAQLATGETPPAADRDGVHALRARLASVEAANALLQRKNLELSFLYEASLLLASSIDLSTLGQTVISAVVNASRFKIRRGFVALADGDAFIYHAGHGIEPLDAEQFMFRYRTRLRQCLDRGEVIATRAETLADESGGNPAMCVIIPMRSHPPERGYGCIVITEMDEGGLTGDDLRTLTQLADLAGRSLANAALYSKSVELGMTDSLTGVLNRRYLDRRLADEVKRAQRAGGQLAVIVVDLDLFKSVNDRYGHLEGDRLLQAVARTIGASVRDIDVVTRFGGEEFAVILPGAGENEAHVVAERIRGAIEVMDYTSMTHGLIPMTISGGVAALDRGIHTPAQLIGVADRRLLEAKRAGRNRTVSSSKYLVSGT